MMPLSMRFIRALRVDQHRKRTLLLSVLGVSVLGASLFSLPAHAQLTAEEIRAASGAALTTREFSGTQEYNVLPPQLVDTNARVELTQAEVDAQSEARYERVRLESELAQRQELLPRVQFAEQTATDNLVRFYQDRDGIDARIDFVLDIVGAETDEETALKLEVTSARSRVDGLRTQINDTRTALETASATNTEITARVVELSQQRAQALQANGAQMNTLIADLNQQQQDLAAARAARESAMGMTNLIDEQQYWFEDLYDFGVSITGNENASTLANTALEDAIVAERALTAQIATTQRAITAQQAETAEQDRNYEMSIIQASPRLLAEDEARRSNEAIDNLRNVETQQAQIVAGEEQFANQTTALNRAVTEASTPEAVAQAQNDLRLATEAHEAWRVNMDSELSRHQQQQEHTFEQNRVDGIGETNSGETRSTIRGVIRDVNESTTLTETQRNEMIQDLSAVDQGAVTSTGRSALVIASSAPNMVEFENTWGTFLDDYQDSVVDLSWTEFSLRMGAYTKGVTRAGVDAVKDLVMLVGELGDTQGELFEAMLEEVFGVRSDVFGSENLATLERIRSGMSKIMDPNDPEGARLAAELVALGEKVATMVERRLESTAGSGNVLQALEDTGYVVGTVVGIEEAAFRIAAQAPKAVRGIGLWVDASRVAPPAGTTQAAGAAGDASRAATGTGAIPTDGTPWGTHLEVEVISIPPGDSVVLLRSDGTQLRLERKLGEGSTTKVYEVPGRPDIVVRITSPDPTGAALDNAGQRALRSIDPDGSIFGVPERYQSHGVRDVDGTTGGQLEIVERAPTDWRKAKAAGETLSDGRRAAYQRGMDKINESGFVMLDNKADNYAFVKTGEPDEWKLVIVDAGSVVPMKNLDSAAAARLQHALDNPIDEATAAGRQWDRGERGDVTGRQIHTEWLAENFDGLIDWDAINALHPDLQFETLGAGYKGSDLLLNKRFPMNPMNGIENPGISGPLRPATGSTPPTMRERLAAARARANAANEASGPYTGTARNPVRTGGDGDDSGGGGGFISIGGFSGTPVVDPIHFELGPGSLTGSISTYCPPCSHISDEYNMMALVDDQSPASQARMQMLLTQLSVCEDFYCYDEDLDDGYWELVQVIGHLGNNAYDARDPNNESSTSIGSDQIRVLLVNGSFVPVRQFNSTSDAHSSNCAESHYHIGNAASSPVLDCQGNSQSDPASGFCGFGTVSGTFQVPMSSCPFFE